METQTQTEKYTATVDCYNCKKTYTIEIPKGKLIDHEKCHVCGCQTLAVKKNKD